MLILKTFCIIIGAWAVESTTYPCQSKISTNGYGLIQSPDFPAVKTPYTCRNFFYYPQPKGAVLLNITDISLYYYKDQEKVCSGALEIGTYKAPCLEAKPFCIVYFNDMKCIQSVLLKYKKCLWYQNTGRSVDTVITSDGRVGQEETDNSTITSSWSYPKGVRMTYEFVDCPQDPTATESTPLTARTTLIPGATVDKSFTAPPNTLPPFIPWMMSTTARSNASTTSPTLKVNTTAVAAPGALAEQNQTTTIKQRYKAAGSLTFPEIIIMSVVLFVVVVVLTIVIILIVVKAKARRKSWTAKLPSVLGRDYRIPGDVPPPARTNAA